MKKISFLNLGGSVLLVGASVGILTASSAFASSQPSLLPTSKDIQTQYIYCPNTIPSDYTADQLQHGVTRITLLNATENNTKNVIFSTKSKKNVKTYPHAASLQCHGQECTFTCSYQHGHSANYKFIARRGYLFITDNLDLMKAMPMPQ